MFNTFLSPGRLIELYDATVCDQHGERLGSVGHVYVDDGTGHATWATARSGLFGRRDLLVPLQGASYDGHRILVPFDAHTIAAAPEVEVSDRVSPLDEDLLLTYYAEAASRQQQVVAELVAVYRKAAGAPGHRRFASQETTSHETPGLCDSRFVSFSTRPAGEPTRIVAQVPVEPQERSAPASLEPASASETVWEGDATDRDLRVQEDVWMARERFASQLASPGWGELPTTEESEHVPTAGEIVERSVARRGVRSSWSPRARITDRTREGAGHDSTA